MPILSPDLITPEPVSYAPDNNKPDAPDPTDIERAVVDEIAKRDQTAKTASMPYRREFQAVIQKSFGEWISPNDVTPLGEYYANIIGRKGNKLTDFLVDMTIPDPGNYSHVQVIGKKKGRGSRLAPGVSFDELEASAKSFKRGERALTGRMQEICRDIKFVADARYSMEMVLRTGNSLSAPEYRQSVRAVAPPDVMESDMMEFSGFGADGAGGPKYELKVTNSGYRIRRIDMRNHFPGSIQQDEGITGLKWWTEYFVTDYSELCAGKMRRGPDGTVHGCYRNLQALQPEAETYVNRIYYDDITGNFGRGQGLIPPESYLQVERGFRGTRYIGAFGVSDFKVGNEYLTRRQWDSFVRSFGNDPDECRFVRYWIVEIITPSAGPGFSGKGTLVRFEPYPFKNGSECPYVHDRFMLYPGLYYGQGIFKSCTGSEELFNIHARAGGWAAIMGSKPPVLFNKSAIDQDYLEANNGALNLTPGKQVPANGDVNVDLNVLRFLNPLADSLPFLAAGMGAASADIDEAVGIYAPEMGAVSKGVTATNVAAAEGNAKMSIKQAAVMRETLFISPILDMLLQQHLEMLDDDGVVMQANNYGEAEGMAALDDTLEEMVRVMDRESLERLLPVEIAVKIDMEQNSYHVVVVSNAASGGRGAQAEALAGYLTRCTELNGLFPNQYDLVDINDDLARLEGIVDPQRYRMTPPNMERADVMMMDMMQRQASQGGVAAPAGKPSAPKDSGQYNPMEALGA